MIELQHLLHASQKLGRDLSDAPLQAQMGLQDVFFRMPWMVVWLISSIQASSTTLSANKRSVQRACPSGAVLQARAVIWARRPPSTRVGAALRALSRIAAG